jgi:hypothetical protein
MNVVTNEEMDSALKNEDYIKIMGKACVPFYWILSPDEIETCKMTALWKALRGYKENTVGQNNKAVKFTSYLYRGVFLECKTYTKFIQKGRQDSGLSDFNSGSTDKNISSYELIEELNGVKDGDLLYDCYFNNHSIEEISQKTGLSKQTMGAKKKKALERLRKRLA